MIIVNITINWVKGESCNLNIGIIERSNKEGAPWKLGWVASVKCRLRRNWELILYHTALLVRSEKDIMLLSKLTTVIGGGRGARGLGTTGDSEATVAAADTEELSRETTLFSLLFMHTEECER